MKPGASGPLDDAPILYEEQGLLAVNKPAGIAVVPGRGPDGDDCLRLRLEEGLGRRLWVVHRIDKPVTGVALFATNAEAHREMSMRFEAGLVRRRYTAWVLGVPAASAGRIDIPIEPGRKGRMRGASSGKPSRTDYRVLETIEVSPRSSPYRASLLEVELLSGRRHQIRLHLAYEGHPILFDPLYAGPRAGALEALCAAVDVPRPPESIHLHARSLSWSPGGGAPEQDISAPLPPWFRLG